MILVFQFITGALLFASVMALSLSGLTGSNPWGHKAVLGSLLMWSIHLMASAHDGAPIDAVSTWNALVIAGYMTWRATAIRGYLARH